MSSASPVPNAIASAQLEWNDVGTPVSSAFGDVYFSNDNGLAETRYVFLTQNGLPERLGQHDSDLFVIGETGFGTGLNFLAIWHAFREHLHSASSGARRLHFISFEKYPLTRADLQQALTHWPELADVSSELLRHYPHLLAGCHRLLLDEGRVTLDLWLGDIKDTLPQVSGNAQQGVIDAWFLDGFAPSKNPEMWTEQLFAGLARLARNNATIATFTCAGFVRRGLQAAGFAMQKVKGHGNKREMLRGIRQPRPMEAGDDMPPASVTKPDRITLIGGGMASLALAWCLTRRGVHVELLCADASLAQGASGNRQGALYPLLNADHDRLSRFYAPAFGFARRFYQQLFTRHPVAHDWCGVIQFASDARSQKKLQRLSAADFPTDLVQAVSSDERDRLAGLPLGNDWNATASLFYPDGGWLAPAGLAQAMWRQIDQTGLATLRTECRVDRMMPTEAGWQLHLASGETITTLALVLASGHTLPDLLPERRLPIYPVRGQVSHLETTTELLQLRRVLCADGYLTPADNAGQHCLGASYGRNDTDLAERAEEHSSNLQRLQQSLPTQPWTMTLQPAAQGRVGLRAATRDHLPVAGALSIPDKEGKPLNLWLFGALGSRGLCSAPLLAEYLASAICREPLPLAPELQHALAPTRFDTDKAKTGIASR
ncbi:bifunctional tRNA (5-methylaminomethyl-2-thiouridine)(34)-methyltransferase MnmD/FAD-dependent 5-carboxymethylaminomethyl-2-thiouridine(34) oxidoreductase MnmC [Pseudaeromonas sharmana]|uniref:tRNA 5-methylaminomethyl-2-thiouridine biosynthesis bifunctional protein MnmC n=1 Tax=Pseudaeromonas sharmana TaxID=328412 RepID=A0ABV8CJU7_9GAMM